MELKAVNGMTMQELARLANVSVSTVSKAFHQADDVSEETKQHIFAVAKQYGCYGKFFKGKYPKRVIAVVCPELKSQYYSIYVEKLQHIIEAHNAIPLVLSYNFDNATQAELLEYFSAYLQVDGIIVFALKNQLKKGFNTPLVSLFSSQDETVDTVSVDIASAAKQAVACLRAQGHRHIAVAGEKKTKGRQETLCDALGIDMSDAAVYVSAHRFEQAGIDCADRILQAKIPYTAILCTYDNIAIGVMKHLAAQGYAVPRDVSVVGINNIPFSQYAKPSLSTVDEHIDEMCDAAWQLLEKKMKNIYYHPPAPICLTGTFLRRESVGKTRETNENT